MMNILSIYTSLYARLDNSPFLPYWVLTPFRRIVRTLANWHLPHYLCRKKPLSTQRKTGLIVSLTSFPARINEVWMVVESIKRQTVLPEKIILWLSSRQFPSPDSIPANLRKEEDGLFQIRMVDEDIRSHKKYYYAAQEYPDSFLILVDDDIFYPTDMIERLLEAQKENQGCVICRYGREIDYSNSREIKPYAIWKNVNNYSKDSRLFFGTGGGTLFKPSMCHKDLLNKDLFLKLAPLADDIWVNAMVRLTRIPIVMLQPELLLPVLGSGSGFTLCKENVGDGKNDLQIKSVSEFYIKSLGIDPFRADYTYR